nr:ribonuclease H-like domain-containing protein [Tanacetum cinerariifolium]
MLDQTFDRLQKLVRQLEFLGEKLLHEDVSQKLLRRLSPEWKTHVVSDQAEEGLNYALMAFTSSTSYSKIVENCKKGLGYESYNAVPPPYTGNFKPLKPDLSFIGLDEFVDKPKVSDDEEDEVTQPKIEKKIVKPNIAKIEFVTPKQPEKTSRKNNKKMLKVHDREHVISYRYEKIDRGYVAFGGNPKVGKITGKVPRKNNMYSVDLKNIVPKGGLTCLFAKATSDESKLWHRRLGHLNFKTMNKLVKGNLVRVLPSKLFENVETCVACQKGKQHRASCSGPDCLFGIDALTRTMNYEPIAAGTQSNGFADPKSSQDDGFQPSSDHGKKVNEDPKQESECKYQEKEANDERHIVIRNKARLVAQGHIQGEGIDYDEVFTPVVRIEAIRLFLAYASFKDFVVYQMDVKRDFLLERLKKRPDIMFAVCACARYQVNPKVSHLYAVERIFRFAIKDFDANGCWDLVVEVVGCSRDGERGRKTRESRVYRVWREALCCA